MKFSRKSKIVLLMYVSGTLIFSYVLYLLVKEDHIVAMNQEFQYLATGKPLIYDTGDLKSGYSTEQIPEKDNHKVPHLLRTVEGQSLNNVAEINGNIERGKVVNLHDNAKDDVDGDTFSREHLEVYVVEEHHEVIPYWFGAAERGLIQKEGNILVHIDGHSDMAPLTYVPGYPFFKWPAQHQLKYLMQRNDGFIQASAMVGLIDRMVWVWPTWDKKNPLNPHAALYVTYKVHLGWMDVRNETEAQTAIAFCMCTEDKDGFQCFTTTKIESDFMQEDFYHVSRNRCQIKKTMRIEEVGEQFAIKYFKEFEWNLKKRSILLDIDEDFYGCSYAVNPILNVIFDLQQVEKTNELIHKVFCPVNSEQDNETSEFLVYILSEIAKGDNCQNDIFKKSVKCIKYIKDKTTVFRERLVKLISQKLIKFCEPIFDLFEVIKTLLRQFAEFSTEQILSLVEVGFCLNTSPKTHDIYGWRKFGICMGANSPNHSAILEHTPTEKEVFSRSVILKGILKEIKHPVNIVTIARSVRDGYTPRKFFEQIEQDIIGALRATIDNNVHVFYDENLLGGRKGWGTRIKD